MVVVETNIHASKPFATLLGIISIPVETLQNEQIIITVKGYFSGPWE